MQNLHTKKLQGVASVNENQERIGSETMPTRPDFITAQRNQFYAVYHAYLRTPEWIERRDAAIARARGRCQMCNSDYGIQVHHRDYSRLGHEDPEDLTAVCAQCHRIFSFRFTPSRTAFAESEHGAAFVERSMHSKSAWQSRAAKAKKNRKPNAPRQSLPIAPPCEYVATEDAPF